MLYTMHYDSPLGNILLAGDETALSGLWFEGAKYFAAGLPRDHAQGNAPVLEETKRWLDIYFSGNEPDFMPPMRLSGTPFQLSVWHILRQIPYGCTTTYGAIAAEIASLRGLARMSAQAVGGAVGHNPISILIPCHRVLGSNGSLTGYAGGIHKKNFLLRLEGVSEKAFSVSQ